MYSFHICISCMYVFIDTYIYVYIYIYIRRVRAGRRAPVRGNSRPHDCRFTYLIYAYLVALVGEREYVGTVDEVITYLFI